MLEGLLTLSLALVTTAHAVAMPNALPAPNPARAFTPVCNVVTSPNPGASGYLTAVTAISDDNAWAVGQFYDPQNGKTYALAEHWNGATWTITSNPEYKGEFLGVTAVPNSPDVWALGDKLIELWNGSAWSVVPAPRGGSLHGGIAALSTTDAWAVGEANAGYQPFIAHWNGNVWKPVRSPNMPTYSNLQAVVALSANDVWAVGNMDVPPNLVLSLTEHWNGKAWTVVSSPNPQGSSGVALLDGVTVSGGSVFAVGFVQENKTTLPFVLKWTASGWQIVPGPPTNGPSAFTSVAADGSGGIWAAGWTSAPSAMIPLLAHFDGVRWTLSATANPAADSQFSGVAQAPGGKDVWTVGVIGNGAQGFTERCPG